MHKERLSDVAEIIMGTSPSGDTYNENGTGKPLLNGPTEFGQTSPNCTLYTTDSKKECQPGDLIFCVRGSTTGRMNWADKVYSLGRGVCSIRGNTELETKYIKYAIDVGLEQLLKYAGGGTFPNLTKATIHDFEIPFTESRFKIASILSAFDDLIENNTRRIAILEEMARLIYREWFVYYRYPGHENDKVVDSGTDLGGVPEGWGVGTVGDLYDVKSGFAFKSKKLVDQGSYGVIKIGNIQSGNIDVDGVQFIENDKVPDRATKFKLNPGDILIAMTGAKVGKVGIMPKTKNPFYLNQRVGKYFGNNELLKSHMYLYTFLNSREAQANIEHLAQGAAQPNISATNLKSLKLPIPPKQILKEFEELTLSMRDEMLVLRQKNVKLKETRDLLLPRLISGKIKIQ